MQAAVAGGGDFRNYLPLPLLLRHFDGAPNLVMKKDLRPALALTMVACALLVSVPVLAGVAAPPKNVDDTTEAAGVPSWGLGPFVRCPQNPLIKPRTDTTFFCPILKTNVTWEGKNIVGAAAAVREGKVYWLYRAEPKTIHHSRVGLGISTDGIHFKTLPTPVLYPDNDAFKQYEWPGGTEDGRVVQREDGLSIYLYSAYNGKQARQAVATSPDLIHWTKQGLAFAKADGGKYQNIEKGGQVICHYYDDGRVVAAKINGKYWMYTIGYNVAYSDDCINWTPMLNARGGLVTVLPLRPGKFDSLLVEPGPPAIVTPKGILVIYHGANSLKKGDPHLPDRSYSGGQALFDLNDPTKLIARCDSYFLTPRTPYELQYALGAPVCFMEGLVRFKGKWLLYYEGGDHVGCMASCNQPVFETAPTK
jgi:predicted GH43/DUF377 family glycosyl hydrolase